VYIHLTKKQMHHNFHEAIATIIKTNQHEAIATIIKTNQHEAIATRIKTNQHEAIATIIKTNQITRIFLFEINKIYFLVCSQPFQEMKESNPSHGELGSTVKKELDETSGGTAKNPKALNELWEAQWEAEDDPEARNSKSLNQMLFPYFLKYWRHFFLEPILYLSQKKSL